MRSSCPKVSALVRAGLCGGLFGLGLAACGDDVDTTVSMDDGGMRDGGMRDGRADDHDAASDEERDAAPDADEPFDSMGGLRVRLSTGIVEGGLDGQARVFLGIPFAAPPTGELRFAAPRPPEAWSGVLEADDFPPSCPQLADQGAPASEVEDCLYLNVWAPEAPDEPAPVMVWIHGGGNFSGGTGIPIPSTDQLWYDGRVFAEDRGVVLVTVQYRLGPLGFNAHPALGDDDEPLGNQGLHDQRFALQWVRDNIEAFGGDPDNVTIFGESAGAANVCYHVASPQSRGLFHRAIGQSGGCTIRTVGPEASAAGAGEQMVAYGEALGCPAGDAQLACMRQASISELLEHAMQPMPGAGETVENAWRFGAVIDGPGGFLPDDLRALFDAGEIAQVPYLLGANHDEGTTFVWRAASITTQEAYLADLEMRFGDAAESIAEVYPASDFDGNYNAARARVVGDSSLVCGTHDTARRAAAAGLPVYLYDFDYPWALSAATFRAGHAAEISHVFGLPYLPTPDAVSEALAEDINTYWANFATHGDPNDADAPAQWPLFTAEQDRRLQLSPDWALLTDFRKDECEFWRAYHDAD